MRNLWVVFFLILGTIHFPWILSHCLSLLLKCSLCLHKLLTCVKGWHVYLPLIIGSLCQRFNTYKPKLSTCWTSRCQKSPDCSCVCDPLIPHRQSPQGGQSLRSFLQVGHSGLWGNPSLTFCILLDTMMHFADSLSI